MDFALVLSALLMGLAGAPHCAAMCGAACAAFSVGPGRGTAVGFHVGRLLSYALAGALVATAMGTAQRLAGWSGAIRPLWTLVHLAALGLGLWLLVFARQPAWLEQIGRAPVGVASGGWQAVRGPGRSALAGLAWVAWPCGLLQSALLVAALANHAAAGAMVMAVFAGSSSLGLLFGPVAWSAWKQRRGPSDAAHRWAVRLAGATLATASSWALGHDLFMRVAAWCTS